MKLHAIIAFLGMFYASTTLAAGGESYYEDEKTTTIGKVVAELEKERASFIAEAKRVYEEARQDAEKKGHPIAQIAAAARAQLEYEEKQELDRDEAESAARKLMEEAEEDKEVIMETMRQEGEALKRKQTVLEEEVEEEFEKAQNEADTLKNPIAAIAARAKAEMRV